jgi:hypothetical protein
LFNLEEDPEELNNLADDPEYKSVIDDLSQLLFADGWVPDIAEQIDQRLSTFGHPVNMKAYRDILYGGELANDPLPIECPDYWTEHDQLTNSLVE